MLAASFQVPPSYQGDLLPRHEITIFYYATTCTFSVLRMLPECSDRPDSSTWGRSLPPSGRPSPSRLLRASLKASTKNRQNHQAFDGLETLSRSKVPHHVKRRRQSLRKGLPRPWLPGELLPRATPPCCKALAFFCDL